jgi:hypothetical protein
VGKWVCVLFFSQVEVLGGGEEVGNDTTFLESAGGFAAVLRSWQRRLLPRGADGGDGRRETKARFFLFW